MSYRFLRTTLDIFNRSGAYFFFFPASPALETVYTFRAISRDQIPGCDASQPTPCVCREAAPSSTAVSLTPAACHKVGLRDLRGDSSSFSNRPSEGKINPFARKSNICTSGELRFRKDFIVARFSY